MPAPWLFLQPDSDFAKICPDGVPRNLHLSAAVALNLAAATSSGLLQRALMERRARRSNTGWIAEMARAEATLRMVRRSGLSSYGRPVQSDDRAAQNAG
jgi:uncharacterized membrane protein (DUF2068 family)